jgi:hypothetical protein
MRQRCGTKGLRKFGGRLRLRLRSEKLESPESPDFLFFPPEAVFCLQFL